MREREREHSTCVSQNLEVKYDAMLEWRITRGSYQLDGHSTPPLLAYDS